MLFVPVGDAPFGQVVGREFDAHAVARQDTYEVLTHLAGNLSHHDMLRAIQTNFEEGVGQLIYHHTFRRYQVFFRQSVFSFINPSASHSMNTSAPSSALT